jgi:hypothetical protein
MLRIAGVKLRRCLLSVAFSLYLVEAAPPRAIAGVTQYDVATDVVIEDITTAMLVASAYSGGGTITTSNGSTYISPDGSQFTMSGTRGQLVR